MTELVQTTERTVDRLERLWAPLWARLQGWLSSIGRGLSFVFSREGLTVWGFVFLGMSVFFGWINTPFGGALSATRLSLLPGLMDLGDPARNFHSYGMVLLSVLVFAWLTRPSRRRLRLLRPRGFHVAVGLVSGCLALWFYLTVAFIRPDLLEDLIEQTNELHRIKQFDNVYIGGNVGVMRVDRLTSDTLWDQLGSFSAHLGAGFWYAVLAAVFLVLGGIRILRREGTEGKSRPPYALLGTVGLTVVLLLLAGGLAGQSLVADYLVVRADGWAGRGDYIEALELYRKARNIDHRLAINEAFLEKMGRSAYRAGDRTSPESHFYLAHRYRWDYDYPSAVHHLRQAISKLEEAERIRTIPAYEKYLEEVLTYWGRALYDRDRFQGAVERWQEAFTLDEDSYELPFFLAHAYFQADGVDQSRSIYLNQLLLERVRDRIFRSDLYCNLGEAYYRQKEYAKARLMYEQSLDMYNFVKDINYRAQKGMVGL